MIRQRNCFNSFKKDKTFSQFVFFRVLKVKAEQRIKIYCLRHMVIAIIYYVIYISKINENQKCQLKDFKIIILENKINARLCFKIL